MMRAGFIAALVVVGTVAACSGAPAGPVVVEEPGRVVVVQPGMPGSEPDAQAPLEAGTDARVSIDASDAASLTCTGAETMGAASTNCRPIGPCTLDSCTVGEAYRCGGRPSAGYPLGNMVCVYSATDSDITEGVVNCCVKACVREDKYDGACVGAGPAIPHAYHCPPGVVPSTQHQVDTSQGIADLYCAP